MWNDKLNFFIVQLTVYDRFTKALDLELEVQPRFVEFSADVERLMRRKERDASYFREKRRLLEKMEGISGLLFRTFRDLTKELVRRESEEYLGRVVKFSEETLDEFSTWYLFKALFKRFNSSQAVIGSAENSSLPIVFRN
jgi:hypothetical protein